MNWFIHSQAIRLIALTSLNLDRGMTKGKMNFSQEFELLA